MFSPPSIFLFPFFFFNVETRAKRHTTWRLNVHSALCVAAQEIDLLSAFFFFFFSCARRNMQRCRLQGDFRCDNYELLIRCYHFPFTTYTHAYTLAHSPVFDLWCRPSIFSSFFLRLRCVTFCGCDTLHLVQPIHTHTYTYIHIYIFLFHSGFPSAHDTNASAILLSSLVNFIK